MALFLPQTPMIPPIRSLDDADRAIQALVGYLERLRTATSHESDGAAPVSLLPFVNVRQFGAKGDGVTDDTTAIQAAIDAVAAHGDPDLPGGTVFFPPGEYRISAPLVLPRSGINANQGIVHLVGASVRAVRLKGAAGFPPNRAMIEWEINATQTWHQRIAHLAMLLPNVAGTMAIWYQPTDGSSAAAIRAETLQIDLEDLLLEGNNRYNPRHIWLQGNIKHSHIRRVYGDAHRGDGVTYQTIVLETDSTFPNDDASGLHFSTITDLHAGLRQGGWLQAFKGRIHRTVWDTCFANGTLSAPSYEFINSQIAVLRNLANEGKGSQPQWKLTACKQFIMENCGTGAPLDVGAGVGNGIEMVACEDFEWRGHFSRVGNNPFNPQGVKQLVLDANCKRNRFFNFLIRDTLADEVTNNAPDTNDNYGEFYDVNRGQWHFLGRERVGVQVPQEPILTFADGDTTPSVAGGTIFKTANTAPTTITTFDDGVAGQRITLIFTDANTTVAETGNIRLSAAFTSSPDDTLELLYDGTTWYEISRSAN